jgi:hypothetical protein
MKRFTWNKPLTSADFEKKNEDVLDDTNTARILDLVI